MITHKHNYALSESFSYIFILGKHNFFWVLGSNHWEYGYNAGRIRASSYWWDKMRQQNVIHFNLNCGNWKSEKFSSRVLRPFQRGKKKGVVTRKIDIFFSIPIPLLINTSQMNWALQIASWKTHRYTRIKYTRTSHRILWRVFPESFNL
jgi:hypothetical protein